MVFKFLKNISTVEELKKQYRKLAKEKHPDQGGTNEDFIQLKKEFDYLAEQLEKAGKQQEGRKETSADLKQFSEVLDKIVHLDIDIEICGSWIWVSGNTYPVREQLDKAGFWFSGAKKKWYWYPGEKKKKRRGNKSMKQIREKYGSTKVSTKESKLLA